VRRNRAVPAAAPSAQVVHGATGCMLSLNDMHLRPPRPPRPLADGETVDLGGKEVRTRRVRHLAMPHVPHNWESQVLFEEATGTVLCGDLFS
jgi:glyoxylase-like metal-dependent hydrolase (beta-lactamase superfamily II)